MQEMVVGVLVLVYSWELNGEWIFSVVGGEVVFSLIVDGRVYVYKEVYYVVMFGRDSGYFLYVCFWCYQQVFVFYGNCVIFFWYQFNIVYIEISNCELYGSFIDFIYLCGIKGSIINSVFKYYIYGVFLNIRCFIIIVVS